LAKGGGGIAGSSHFDVRGAGGGRSSRHRRHAHAAGDPRSESAYGTETREGSSDYLAGGALSFADLFLAPILASVEQMPEGQRLLTSMPNIRRAQAVMRARPSFSATAPQQAG
jgi:glutathione S-transferase